MSNTLTSSNPVPDLAAALDAALFGAGAPQPALVEAALLEAQSLDGDELTAFIHTCLPWCQRLYDTGRSIEALPVARTCQTLARKGADLLLQHRVAAAYGNMLGDSGAMTAAIQQHAHSLKLAQQADDPRCMARAWLNIGVIFYNAGVYLLAVDSYRRAVKLLPRCNDLALTYRTRTNLAISHLHLKDVKAGLASARKAQRLETPDLIAQRPFNTVMLRRTHIRLLVLAGRPVEAAPLVESILALGRAHPSPPIDIAVLLAHGSYDMAVGQHDVGLTRLRQALALARHDLTSLSDALITVADAEAQAGNRDAAAVYTAQLADLIHAEAVQEARKQIEISSLYQHIEEEAVSSVIIAFEALQQPVHPQTLKENFEMLSITASFRLDKTGHHGPRVGDLSYLLAAEAGYESPTADLIGYAARFHDIGLLAAPIELFQSPRFSPADIETIRRHARTGADMLTTSKHPVAPMAAEIAHYHHEHWDGNGYPEGIMGNAIPRPARICAIADVFDALMSPRPHRPALGLSDALVKLATLAGNQLDPELTALFIRSAEQGKIRHYLTGLSSSPSLPALDDMLARLPHQ